MKNKFLLNTLSNYAVLAVKLALTFIMTPILVRHLGLYDYGIWEIVVALIGYAGILDLGLTPTISRYAAKYQALNNRYELQSTFSTSLLFMLLIGLTMGSIVAFVAINYPELITNEVGSYSRRYRYLLLLIAIQLAFKFPGIVSESFLEGFQQYYLKNLVTIINTIIGASIIYALISDSNALILLALINTIGLSIKYVVFFIFLTKEKDSQLRFSIADGSIEKLKTLLRFGLKSFVQGISFRLETGTDALVIAYFIGTSTVPFYTIPAGLIGYLRTILMTSTHVFMPLFSNLHARNQNDEIVRIYLLASRLVVPAALLLGIGIISYGPHFIALWLGPEFFSDSRKIIPVLTLYALIPSINPFCSRYLTAIGEHGIFAKLAPISALLNLMFSIVFVQHLGIWGVAIGSLIPVVIFTPIYLTHSCRHLKVSISSYIRSVVLPSVVPAIIAILVAYVCLQSFSTDGYLSIFAQSIGVATAFCASYYFFSLNAEMRTLLISLVRSN